MTRQVSRPSGMEGLLLVACWHPSSLEKGDGAVGKEKGEQARKDEML